jgi:hypothetical protein
VLAIVSLIGLFYLTKFSYEAKVNSDDVASIDDFNKNHLIFCKVTTALVWVQIIIAVSTAVWVLSNDS